MRFPIRWGATVANRWLSDPTVCIMADFDLHSYPASREPDADCQQASGFMSIDPNHKTLKCRSSELRTAAAECADQDTRALLLFYAAECILKAHYMSKFALRSTAASNALKPSARSYAHRLDNLLIALQVRNSDCPARPGTTRLRNGLEIDVGQLHEAWRYGEKVDKQPDVLAWLGKVIAYAEARI